jgi:hypothetical protein
LILISTAPFSSLSTSQSARTSRQPCTSARSHLRLRSTSNKEGDCCGADCILDLAWGTARQAHSENGALPRLARALALRSPSDSITPSSGRVLLERNVSPHLIVIGGVFRKDAPKMFGVEHDHMIRALAPNRANQAFNVSVLPSVSGTTWDDRSRIPIGRTRALNATPNARSLSRMRYFGALSHGNVCQKRSSRRPAGAEPRPSFLFCSRLVSCWACPVKISNCLRAPPHTSLKSGWHREHRAGRKAHHAFGRAAAERI